nr:GNAT family N-acetyltransferase [Kribbella sandramycini]
MERLTAEHADALLAFELDNRAYFARSIADRGDAFFANFTAVLADRLAEQATGDCQFHVLVDAAGAVVGRVNLVDLASGSAELGYRIAESATGRGLATAAVRAVARLAATDYGLHRLTAGTSSANAASRAVLERTGFRQVLPPAAEPLDGRTVGQVTYELVLEGS